MASEPHAVSALSDRLKLHGDSLMPGSFSRSFSRPLEGLLGLMFEVPGQPLSFVRVIDYMGSEAAIVQAARVSYGLGTETPSTDRALVRSLLRRRHTSPFEQCEIKLHLKMPIFVARQWIRHRTAALNEYSARYSVVPEQTYCPQPANVRIQHATERQATFEPIDDVLDAETWLRMLDDRADESFAAYHRALELGVGREQARIGLPLSTYTEFYWKIDLHNLLHFLELRLDSHAQQEIRVFAEVIAELVALWVPEVWAAFVDYRLEAVTLSRAVKDVLLDMLRIYENERSEDPAGVMTEMMKDAGIGKAEIGETIKALFGRGVS